MTAIFEFEKVVTRKAIKSQMKKYWYCGLHFLWFNPTNVSGCKKCNIRISTMPKKADNVKQVTPEMEDVFKQIEEENRKRREQNPFVQPYAPRPFIDPSPQWRDTTTNPWPGAPRIIGSTTDNTTTRDEEWKAIHRSGAISNKTLREKLIGG